MLIPYVIYLVIIGIFLLIGGLGVYHIHRFSTEWGRIRLLTIVFVAGSVVLIGASLYFMTNIQWDNYF